jgi:PPE-repeat protein
MAGVPPIVTLIYSALPPEVNTSRLMAGAGPAPMLQAAMGWEVLAISLETQADELAGALAALTSAWSGTASEQAVASTMPMVVWLRTTAMQAQKRAMQATMQANSYTTAMATTPPIPEIEQNHITHGVLESTNFLGVNTVPIGMNEFDYFVRMWNQAADVMHAYQAETATNMLFEPILPMKPIVIPGVGESAAGAGMAQAAAMAPGAAAREAAFAHVGAQATLDSAAMTGGRAAAGGNMAATQAEGKVQQADNTAQQGARKSDDPLQQGGQQGMQMMSQMASQLPQMLTQIPQQGMQMVSQPMQQLTQPLQQVSQLFSQMGGMGGGDKGAQMGLIGASPFSNHPLAGGSGASSGAGLVRAASLPGAGGTSARTPLMSNLVGEGKLGPVGVAPGAAAGGAGAGLAPVGAGTGSGGGMGPMMGGHRGKSGGSRAGLQAPAPLEHDLGEEEADDW